jgi:hypothetical protein
MSARNFRFRTGKKKISQSSTSTVKLQAGTKPDPSIISSSIANSYAAMAVFKTIFS